MHIGESQIDAVVKRVQAKLTENGIPVPEDLRDIVAYESMLCSQVFAHRLVDNIVEMIERVSPAVLQEQKWAEE